MCRIVHTILNPVEPVAASNKEEEGKEESENLEEKQKLEEKFRLYLQNNQQIYPYDFQRMKNRGELNFDDPIIILQELYEFNEDEERWIRCQ